MLKYTYFKWSGKYYHDNKFPLPDGFAFLGKDGTISSVDMGKVAELVNHQKRTQTLPGISSKWEDGYIMVDHEQGYPVLITPGAKDVRP